LLLLASFATPPELDIKERLAAEDLRSIAVVPSPLLPASELEAPRRGINQGAVIGGAGGAAGGAALGYGSAGVLCTVGGPLCALVVVPAAIVGGLVGGVAGGVIQNVGNELSDEGKARRMMRDAVVELRSSERLAEAAYRAVRVGTSFPLDLLPDAKPDYRDLGGRGITAALEVAVTRFDVLAREKDMALSVSARSRMYRTADGKLLEEYAADAKTEFRRYEDWAANEAELLRQALERSLTELGQGIARAHLGAPPRTASAERGHVEPAR
jgi:hypothetical protein